MMNLENLKEKASKLKIAIEELFTMEDVRNTMPQEDIGYLQSLKNDMEESRIQLQAYVDRLNDHYLLVEETRDDAEEVLSNLEELLGDLDDIIE